MAITIPVTIIMLLSSVVDPIQHIMLSILYWNTQFGLLHGLGLKVETDNCYSLLVARLMLSLNGILPFSVPLN
jgi:hypothetical protein